MAKRMLHRGVEAVATAPTPSPSGDRKTYEITHHIKAWREAAQLSTDALGHLAGCTGSMISQLERGKTTYTQKTLEGVARALGIQAWQLLAGSPKDNEVLWQHVLAAALPIDINLREITDENRAKLQCMIKNNCRAAFQSASELDIL